MLASCVLDHKEMAFLLNMRDSYKTALPCGKCMCPRDQMNNPLWVGPAKTHKHVEEIVRPLVEVVKARKKGTVGPANAALKAISMHPFISPLWDLPYGGHLGGLHSAVNPDLLHQYSLGMEKNAVIYMFEFLRRYTFVKQSALPCLTFFLLGLQAATLKQGSAKLFC